MLPGVAAVVVDCNGRPGVGEICVVIAGERVIAVVEDTRPVKIQGIDVSFTGKYEAVIQHVHQRSIPIEEESVAFLAADGIDAHVVTFDLRLVVEGAAEVYSIIPDIPCSAYVDRVAGDEAIDQVIPGNAVVASAVDTANHVIENLDVIGGYRGVGIDAIRTMTNITVSGVPLRYLVSEDVDRDGVTRNQQVLDSISIINEDTSKILPRVVLRRARHVNCVPRDVQVEHVTYGNYSVDIRADHVGAVIVEGNAVVEYGNANRVVEENASLGVLDDVVREDRIMDAVEDNNRRIRLVVFQVREVEAHDGRVAARIERTAFCAVTPVHTIVTDQFGIEAIAEAVPTLDHRSADNRKPIRDIEFPARHIVHTRHDVDRLDRSRLCVGKSFFNGIPRMLIRAIFKSAVIVIDVDKLQGDAVRRGKGIRNADFTTYSIAGKPIFQASLALEEFGQVELDLTIRHGVEHHLSRDIGLVLAVIDVVVCVPVIYLDQIGRENPDSGEIAVDVIQALVAVEGIATPVDPGLDVVGNVGNADAQLGIKAAEGHFPPIGVGEIDAVGSKAIFPSVTRHGRIAQGPVVIRPQVERQSVRELEHAFNSGSDVVVSAVIGPEHVVEDVSPYGHVLVHEGAGDNAEAGIVFTVVITPVNGVHQYEGIVPFPSGAKVVRMVDDSVVAALDDYAFL